MKAYLRVFVGFTSWQVLLALLGDPSGLRTPVVRLASLAAALQPIQTLLEVKPGVALAPIAAPIATRTFNAKRRGREAFNIGK